ncbi:lipoprotein insertase outer membrane protein LolB [Guyparkeria hydrothermalis]|uniref:lipoprotein insertase outer membrane protein LolB n=1 Tax=Guyparkeria hydrothermalis TaxID=923 RepID=UPI0020226A51|nr:lipoprotein insertase outer membrane protein LolB [Guyparkeria hydrothermalis]MCL7743897.1 lipoprotein insertase outer membrane protein LolB [Guyparkeria hydrothermalis]
MPALSRFRSALAAVALLSVTLGGCASFAPGPAPATPEQLAAWEAHSDRVETLTDWAFSGRAAVKSGLKGGSVSVEWTQVGQVTALTMRGPFDTGRLAMTGTPRRMLITDGDGNRHLTEQPMALLEEQTGWVIPLAALPRWLRGLPEQSLSELPNDAYELDESGHLSRLTESGWAIEYARYAPEGSRALSLPHFVELKQDGMRIRIVVDAWDLGS